MSNDPGGLEAQRLQLERDKVSLEIRKFEADEAKRLYEVKKLEAELRELRRPWYQKPSYLSPLATITVAIVGGFIAFGTDVFKSNVVALRNERDNLSRNVKDLGSAKTILSGENRKLRDDRDALQRNVSTLSGTNANLLKDNQELETDKERLSKEVVAAELKTHLKIIQSFGTPENHLAPDNQSLRSVFAIADQFGGNPVVISVLRNAHNKAQSQELKAALCLALFKAGRQPEWKDRLKQSSMTEVLGAFRSIQGTSEGLARDSIYLSLLGDDSVFTLDERVATLKEMYAVAEAQANVRGAGTLSIDYRRPDPLALIVGWDEAATIKFRDPWFDYLNRLYDLREWENSSWGLSSSPRLLSFAPQAFAILLLASVGDQTTSFSSAWREIPLGIIAFRDVECPYPADVPLCRNLVQATKPEALPLTGPSAPFRWEPAFSVTPESFPAFKEWVEKNQELVSLWTDRTFSLLRMSSDDVMRRIIRRQWINIADLRDSRRP